MFYIYKEVPTIILNVILSLKMNEFEWIYKKLKGDKKATAKGIQQTFISNQWSKTFTHTLFTLFYY